MTEFSDLSTELKVTFRDLAAELAADLGAISGVTLDRITAEVPEYAVDDPVLAEMLRFGARESVRAELLALQNDAELPDQPPSVDTEGARIAARHHMPLEVAIWSYRVGHRAQWDAWYALVARDVTDVTDQARLHAAGSRFFFNYADRLSAWFTREYTLERDRRLVGREQRRADQVREILAGAEGDGVALGYKLDARHIGVVVAGEGLSTEDLGRIATKYGLDLLAISATEQLRWVWFGRIGGEGSEMAEQVGLGLASAKQGTCSVGVPADGVDGFRRSHFQAVDAHRYRPGRTARLTRFDDVELPLLCLRDESAARAFVARQLRGLSGNSTRDERLRATLLEYLRRDGNGAATAEYLSVHPQTVNNRLAAVERRSGRPVRGRRAELEIALHLHDHFERIAEESA